MFNYFIFTIILLSTSTSAKAGGSVGNGGGSWVCRSPNSTIQWVKTVDLFEAENEFGLTVPRVENESVESKLKKIKTKIKQNNVKFSFALNFALQTVKTSYRMVSDVELNITDDSLFRIKPAKKSCANGTITYEQIANFTEYGSILIDRELFEKLTNTEQTALWLHEAIYLLERERRGATNSIVTRKLVGYLMSTAPFEDYLDLMDGYESKNCDYCVPNLKPGYSFSEGLAAFKGQNGLYGYQDKAGRTVIKPRFEFAEAFQKGAAVVRFAINEGEPLQSALINRMGKILYQTKNQNLEIMGSGTQEGVFSVANDFLTEKTSYPLLLDSQGNTIVSAPIEHEVKISRVHENSAAIVNFETRECTYVDGKGAILFKLNNAYACEPFSEGLATVAFYKPTGTPRKYFNGHSTNGALINRKGETVLNFVMQFERSLSEVAGPFKSGLFRAGDGTFLNARGDSKIILPSNLYPVNDFFIQGMLLVSETEPYATLPEIVSPPESTDGPDEDQEKRALYRHYLMNTLGEKIDSFGAWADIGIGTKNESLLRDTQTAWSSDLNLFGADLKFIPVMNGQGKWGYVDIEGKVRVPFLFKEAHPFFDGLAATDLGYISMESLE